MNLNAKWLPGLMALVSCWTLSMAGVVPGRWEKVESLDGGTELMIELKHGDRISGQFVTLASQELVINTGGGDLLNIPRADIRRVVREGVRKDKKLSGTLIGALVGFGTGAAIGFGAGDDGVFDDFTATFNGLVLGGMLAGAGAIAGYTIDRVRERSTVLYTAAGD